MQEAAEDLTKNPATRTRDWALNELRDASVGTYIKI